LKTADRTARRQLQQPSAPSASSSCLLRASWPDVDGRRRSGNRRFDLHDAGERLIQWLAGRWVAGRLAAADDTATRDCDAMLTIRTDDDGAKRTDQQQQLGGERSLRLEEQGRQLFTYGVRTSKRNIQIIHTFVLLPAFEIVN
jgi:hypothetical protein